MQWIRQLGMAIGLIVPALMLASGPVLSFLAVPAAAQESGEGQEDRESDGFDGEGDGEGDVESESEREPNTEVPEPEGNDGAAGGLPGQGPGPAVVTVSGSGNPEVVVVGPSAQVDAAIAALGALGANFLRSNSLGSVGLQVLVFEYPSGASLAAAQEALRTAAPDMNAGFQNIYRFSQFRPRTYAGELVAARASGGCRLPETLRIGMIDGPVDPGHPALQSANVSAVSLLRDGERPAPARHGTAIAGLIVGEDPDGVLSGFARGAELVAVNIFSQRWGRERADVERIAGALDYLLSRDVQLINMSFSGPDNPVLRLVLEATAAQRAILIGAIGSTNDNSATLPAAASSVIGVTAIDARLRRFEPANTGPQVEFAAPGVEVFAARAQRGGYVSGTSFSAPIVTALAASLMSSGATSLDAVRRGLEAQALDLGAAGRDAEFGWGLARSADCRP